MSARDLLETETLRRTLEAQGASPEASARETLRATENSSEEPESLTSLRLVEAGGQASERIGDLELIRTLGEGGMGVVHLAKQPELRREIAVKRLRDRSPRAISSLLKEAQVTGRLEHPNIVPVYALGRDADGAPVVVMKRVSGTSWLELIERGDTPLDQHVRILLRVCSAVHFAHTKGVLHRDIKPENVMIGDFDEVYLLDWGVALEVADAGAPDEYGVVGTPAYMAPEMAKGDPQRLDARSDVYLLGATLHHVISGRPPHDGTTTLRALASALESEPYAYPPSVPSELQAISHRACHVDPSERFETASALAEALTTFLDHRTARELATSGQERVSKLEAIIASAALSDPEPRGAQRTYDEAVFAFRQALRIHPDAAEAKDRLQRAAERLFDFRIARGDAGGAASLVDALDPHDRERRAALRSLQEDTARRDEQLESLLRDRDPTLGRRGRVYLAVGFAVAAIAAAAISAWVMPRHDAGARPLAVMFVGVPLAVMGVWLGLFRRWVMVNELSRIMVLTVCIGIAALVVNRAIMVFVVGADTRSMLLADQGLIALTGAFLALRMPSFWVVVALMIGAWVLAAAQPAWQPGLVTATLVGAPIALALMWQRAHRDDVRNRQR